MKNLDRTEFDFDLIPGCVIEEAGESYARFRIEPIEPGHASSIANPIRRALLNGLSGWAVTSVKIEGVEHEMETVPHARDRVLDILLNLTNTRFRALSPNGDSATAFLRASGEGKVLSGAITSGGAFEIANPENYVTALSGTEGEIAIEMTVEKGLGYRLADMEKATPGVLPTNASFGPVTNAGFGVEIYRVGGRTNMEKAIFHVETDRTITPLNAFREATALLSAQFSAISTCSPKRNKAEVESEEAAKAVSIETLDFSNRALNALKAGEIHTVGDLLGTKRQTLRELKGIGEMSYEEIAAKMDELESR